MKINLRLIILFAVTGIAVACNSTNHPTLKNQKAMFTVEQIKVAHTKVKSGADFGSIPNVVE